MSIEQRGALVTQIQRLFQAGTASGLSEWQLLRRYLASGDEAAFETLVARHGPMILGVCRRMLSNPADVEDAFQATFLVLVRRARGLGERDAIGPWLYGVASRVALRARCETARRASREKPLAEAAIQDADADPIRRELGPILDEELNRLPSKYRVPVVLCYLEGETHDEAARRLGWPLGTVKGRLVRARELLKGRLVRRGLTLSAGSLVASLSREAVAAVPDPLRDATVRAAIKASTGREATAAVGATAVALAEQVLKTMFLTRLTTGGSAALLLAAVGLTAAGVVRSSDVGQARNNAAQSVPSSAENQEAGAGKTAGPAKPASNGADRVDSPVATVAGGPATAPAPRDEQAGKAARAILLRAFDESLVAYAEGKVDVDKVYVWSKRLLESEDAYGSPERRPVAFKAHLDRMGQLRRQVQMRASKGNEINLTLTAAEFYRQEAADTLKDVEKTSEVQNPATTPQPAAPPGSASPTATPFPPPAKGQFPPATDSSRERAKDPRSLATLAVLDRPIEMSFANETPLEDVLKYIKQATKGPDLPDGVTIFVDPLGLMEAEKTMTSPIQIDLQNVPLRRTLYLALKQLGMGYFVDEGMIYITTAKESASDRFPEPMLARPPFLESREKARRGELSLTELKGLIEKLKALHELESLLKDEPAAAPAKAAQ